MMEDIIICIFFQGIQGMNPVGLMVAKKSREYGDHRTDKEKIEIFSVIGRTVTVTVDRSLGSYHSEHKDMY